MPGKYHIAVEHSDPRYAPVFKLSSSESDACLGCLDCAKRNCIYDTYENREFLARQLVDSAGRWCRSCMRCVQECKNQILVKSLNPEYTQLGNDHWTPEIVTTLWDQSETGKIPVSGAGYDGPFHGPGFDEMWTDMSEIVRPTRDGIHGREYISTAIDIGRKVDYLAFEDGALRTALPPFFSTPLPILLDLPERARPWSPVVESQLGAAERNDLLAFTDLHDRPGPNVVPRYRLHDTIEPDASHRMVEIALEAADNTSEAAECVAELGEQIPDTIICVAVPMDAQSVQKIVQLATGGVGVIRLSADQNGREVQDSSGPFITDVVRRAHLELVALSWRDRVTLLAGGGIAMAEHVAKLVGCGADGVVVDSALLVALECRMCMRCVEYGECEVHVDEIDPQWGAQRMTNLLGSWHAQLIEVLGAMGLREVRRLRGEVGRVMFFEQLEEECFAPIFGKRICQKS